MLTTIALAAVIFLEMIEYLVFFDVILSWLSLFGVRFRPKFLRNLLDPVYSLVKRYIPTTFGAFDFTPIIVILIVLFIRGLIIINVPGVQASLNSLIG